MTFFASIIHDVLTDLRLAFIRITLIGILIVGQLNTYKYASFGKIIHCVATDSRMPFSQMTLIIMTLWKSVELAQI